MLRIPFCSLRMSCGKSLMN
ncbi:hypothetical protein E2C01_091492 [Portunus trituberculatus]|uniref:Uncharacterized protein n=1 Tax=Portunus trituberculatus TaxID=210409 RepID=A0A5B7JNR0_PORTR|nr:hypothetical protein [Portunus trituberculatus]